MKENIEKAYNRLIRGLDSGIRLDGASISESIESLEAILEELVVQLEDPGFDFLEDK
ncbi:uncharacterized protein Eint_110425 [Encephalitozoon intestinalis ATCC 50506]|uniref:Uncharacterized protein n=1 Tax=Encephalitozoon intestinalis (strain ATCC 50506) TaxID=876142 RepID=W8P9E8_ENCIT|nr:uncharacterized protein Eint_110425 [Encephalitozoon intestinalis ATCC 50506]AHL30167.1 hypothetical protein Eint_110425 [Encephalitozoon intestinalis ATCC 50506]UTX46398.1 hypothetical protein GPK93_11g20050 [Encephalitozoon intestinalis]